MKFVRWLGAFRKGASSIEESIAWELSQTEREVAAEPLRHCRSRIDHAQIGLGVDESRSTFVYGLIIDGWTEPSKDGSGRLLPKREKRIKDKDFFLSRFYKAKINWHGEAVFSSPKYSAIVCKSKDSQTREKAAKLADKFSLPLKFI